MCYLGAGVPHPRLGSGTASLAGGMPHAWPGLGLGYPPQKGPGTRDLAKNLGLGYLRPCGWTHTCENITFPHSVGNVGGKYVVWCKWVLTVCKVVIILKVFFHRALYSEVTLVCRMRKLNSTLQPTLFNESAVMNWSITSYGTFSRELKHFFFAVFLCLST